MAFLQLSTRMERSENDDVYFAQDFNIFVLRIYFGSCSWRAYYVDYTTRCEKSTA